MMASVEAGQAVTIDVLENDSDLDDTTLTIGTRTAGVDGGTVSIVDGMIRYTADSDFDGIDSFTYTIADVAGAGDRHDEISVNNNESLTILSLNQGFRDFNDALSDLPGLTTLTSLPLNLLTDQLDGVARLQAVFNQLATDVFSAIDEATADVDALLASRGITITHASTLPATTDGRLFEATIDVESVLQGVPLDFDLKLDQIPALANVPASGTLSATMQPVGSLTFGLDGEGFFISPTSTVGAAIELSVDGTGNLGPFVVDVGGSVGVTPAFVLTGVDADGDSRLHASEFGNPTRYSTANIDPQHGRHDCRR
ncbi:MAG: Ig-like domain-containing protein [Pirellulaceae bacterium]